MPEEAEEYEQLGTFLKESFLYKEFLAEREEILRHKWIESEKAGHDIGFEKALLDWITKNRPRWLEARSKRAELYTPIDVSIHIEQHGRNPNRRLLVAACMDFMEALGYEPDSYTQEIRAHL